MKAKPLSLPVTAVGVVDGPASAETQVGSITAAVAEAEPAPHPATAPGNTEGDWLCAWCHHHVANEKYRFPFNGQDQFTFTSPERIPFTIITFSRAFGCREVGTPTLENTWFAGHAWSFCQCDSCGQQLGWFYAGPHHFAGLIKDRIVRGLHVHN